MLEGINAGICREKSVSRLGKGRYILFLFMLKCYCSFRIRETGDPLAIKALRRGDPNLYAGVDTPPAHARLGERPPQCSE